MSEQRDESAQGAYLGPLADPKNGLRRHAVRQTTLTLGGQIAQALLQLGSTIVLARLLVPSDFGLIAMVAVLSTFIGLFRDIGLTQAVIQQDHLSEKQATGIFWTSVGVTVAFTAVMAASAPLVVGFYGESDLAGITVAFAGVFLLTGLGTMPQAILNRQMEFGKIVTGEIASSAVGIVAAIVLAASGAGYWALVALPGVRSAVMTAILWQVCPWRPGRPRRSTDIGAMLRFGTNITGFNVVNFFARNVDNALIGWRWGAGDLGQYASAYKLLTLPLSQINAPLTRVAVPTLARLTDDPDRYRSAYLRIVQISVVVIAPVMALVAVTADWVIGVLLGPGWEEAGTILRWLALAGMVQPLSNTFGWLFMTQNRTGEFFRVGVATSALAVISFLVGLPHGAVGVAASYALVDIFLRTPTGLIWVSRRGPVSRRDLTSVLLVPSVLAAWSAASALALRSTVPGLGSFAGLGVSAGIAALGSLAILLAVPKGRTILGDVRALVGDLRGGDSAG